MKCEGCAVTKAAHILLLIGGLNWGLAVFDMNLVTMLLGSMPMLVTAVYALVGLSAIFMIFKCCMKK